jgi:hypothetical protein
MPLYAIVYLGSILSNRYIIVYWLLFIRKYLMHVLLPILYPLFYSATFCELG